MSKSEIKRNKRHRRNRRKGQEERRDRLALKVEAEKLQEKAEKQEAKAKRIIVLNRILNIEASKATLMIVLINLVPLISLFYFDLLLKDVLIFYWFETGVLSVLMLLFIVGHFYVFCVDFYPQRALYQSKKLTVPHEFHRLIVMHTLLCLLPLCSVLGIEKFVAVIWLVVKTTFVGLSQMADNYNERNQLGLLEK